MMSFTKQFFINNRKRLASMHPSSAIIVCGNRPMQRSGDSPYPFKQDGNFWYLTGIDEPNLILVIDTKNNTELIAYPDQDSTDQIFNGKIDTVRLAETSGIDNYITQTEGQQLHANFVNYDKVYLNLAKKHYGIVVNSLRQETYNDIKKHVKTISDLRPSTDKLRMVKQPEEIETISKAVAITKRALLLAEQSISQGVDTEREVLALINQHFALEHVQHAYEPIVASGKNSLILHYIKNNSSFDRSSKSILLDVGAEYNSYCADISRTFCLENNPKAQKIIDAVTEAQQKIINYLEPGLSWKEVTKYSTDSLLNNLQKIGETINADTINNYFPHSIGHFLGINVHDTGDYRQALAENMVITIEPGYYNPDNGFGVRVEDDVLITSKGAKIL